VNGQPVRVIRVSGSLTRFPSKIQGSMSSSRSSGPGGTGLIDLNTAKSSRFPSGKVIFSNGTVENGANSFSHSKDGRGVLLEQRDPKKKIGYA